MVVKGMQLYNASEIHCLIQRLARSIIERAPKEIGSADNVLVLGVLEAAKFFATSLADALVEARRRLEAKNSMHGWDGTCFEGRVECLFCKFTSYVGMNKGEVSCKFFPDPSIFEGKLVIIADVIVDSGATITAVEEKLIEAGVDPWDIISCCLLKRGTMTHGEGVQYAAATLPFDDFLLGYGLDYKQGFRNTLGIYKLSPEV